MTNLFSDITPGKNPPEEINVIIEIPAKTSNKIEYDEAGGYFKLDRMLHSPMFYPLNYGFIPQTHSGDGDSLDVLVIASTAVPMGALIACRPIGYLVMSDEEGIDNKLIAVPLEKVDPIYGTAKDLTDVPQHILKEVELFFSDYKKLEPGGKHEKVNVEGFKGAKEAKELVLSAIAAYNK